MQSAEKFEIKSYKTYENVDFIKELSVESGPKIEFHVSGYI
jgi:hypothetical protein